MSGFRYEVALSFAGEQRMYVQQVAAGLESAGVAHFFDERAPAEMWGEDLVIYLDRVYRRDARFVAVFVSAEYAEKVWTRTEFRSVVARAIQEKGAYILPVRFDETELPGLLPTTGYLDARQLKPADVVNALLQKLGRTARTTESDSPIRMPRTPPTDFNPYAETQKAMREIGSGLTARVGQLRHGLMGHADERDGRFLFRMLRSGDTLYSFDMWVDDQWGANTIAFYGRLGGGSFGGESNAHGRVEWDRERETVIVRLSNMSLIPEMAHEYRLTPAELVDAIWSEACDQIEREIR